MDVVTTHLTTIFPISNCHVSIQIYSDSSAVHLITLKLAEIEKSLIVDCTNQKLFFFLKRVVYMVFNYPAFEDFVNLAVKR